MLYEKSLESRLSAKNSSVIFYLFFFIRDLTWLTILQILNITYKHNLLIKPYNSFLATSSLSPITIAKLKSEKSPAMGERDLIYLQYTKANVAVLLAEPSHTISHSSAVASGCLKCLKITTFPCFFFFRTFKRNI